MAVSCWLGKTKESGFNQATPSPQLNLAPSDINLALSWLVPSTNFVLQQSTDLISWSSVTNAPALNLTNLQKPSHFPGDQQHRFLSSGNSLIMKTTTPPNNSRGCVKTPSAGRVMGG